VNANDKRQREIKERRENRSRRRKVDWIYLSQGTEVSKDSPIT